MFTNFRAVPVSNACGTKTFSVPMRNAFLALLRLIFQRPPSPRGWPLARHFLLAPPHHETLRIIDQPQIRMRSHSDNIYLASGYGCKRHAYGIWTYIGVASGSNTHFRLAFCMADLPLQLHYSNVTHAFVTLTRQASPISNSHPEAQGHAKNSEQVVEALEPFDVKP
ncbi:uncharacterized protein EI90DRAFT_678288 [Cantharellus anzutake]|uniref:uncharacterized protein n=1 Tax=Cantharellus anzutake TaxID=1750568 RepID=UPI001907736C|nr:uncharacterized protein EI90DRAFT_678288 [Cantharellus anzutake]KAF8332654.1 hypothetical protein EI90DRAFT_678288 [Cantharellus anzutake]